MGFLDSVASIFAGKATDDLVKAATAIADKNIKAIAGAAWDTLVPPAVQALTYSPEAEATFIGNKALGGMWNTRKVAPTYAATKAGLNEDQIWEQLRTHIGVDGKMRQEISDRAMAFLPGAEKKLQDAIGKQQLLDLDSTITHSDLFSAYPELRGYKIKADRPAGHGSFSPATKTISIPEIGAKYTNKEDSPLAVLLHEIQHAVQNIQGWSPGASPDTFTSKLVGIPKPKSQAEQQAYDLLRTNIENTGGKDFGFMKTITNLSNGSPLDRSMANFLQDIWEKKGQEIHLLTPFEQYMRNYGEAEARATAKRMDMDFNLRKAYGPSSFFDRPMKVLEP